MKNEVYRKFIDEAFKRSDAFGFSVDENEELKTCSNNIYLEIEKIDADELFRITGKTKAYCINFWKQREEKHYNDYPIFKNICLPFVKEMQPYRIDPSRCSKTSDHMYYICEETKMYLLKAHAILDWKYPYFPEDIAFYKNGECWFLTTIHEENIEIFADDENEITFWNNLGIEFYNVFDYNNDILYRLKCSY